MRLGDAGFEVGDASALEAEVGAGGLESFVEGAVGGGELADALFEGGVPGGDPLDGTLSPIGLQVAYLAKEFADPGAQGEDPGVGGLEGGLGVQGANVPVASRSSSCSASVRCGDCGSGPVPYSLARNRTPSSACTVRRTEHRPADPGRRRLSGADRRRPWSRPSCARSSDARCLRRTSSWCRPDHPSDGTCRCLVRWRPAGPGRAGHPPCPAARPRRPCPP